MISFILQRIAETDHSTSGILSWPDGHAICKILERGAKNPDHPRIPAGTYRIDRKPIGSSEFDKSFSALLGPSYKGILWLPDVPKRTNIELHTANYIEQLLGCLASGLAIGRDQNEDFCVPGGQSSPAYKALYLAISPQIETGGAALTIRDIAPNPPSV